MSSLLDDKSLPFGPLGSLGSIVSEFCLLGPFCLVVICCGYG